MRWVSSGSSRRFQLARLVCARGPSRFSCRSGSVRRKSLGELHELSIAVHWVGTSLRADNRSPTIVPFRSERQGNADNGRGTTREFLWKGAEEHFDVSRPARRRGKSASRKTVAHGAQRRNDAARTNLPIEAVGSGNFSSRRPSRSTANDSVTLYYNAWLALSRTSRNPVTTPFPEVRPAHCQSNCGPQIGRGRPRRRHLVFPHRPPMAARAGGSRTTMTPRLRA
jgi:hypothetical protein